MAAKRNKDPIMKLGPIADFLRQGGQIDDLKPFLEAVGVKQVWESLSPEQREELLRLVQRDQASKTSK